jgi:hypothetical protein
MTDAPPATDQALGLEPFGDRKLDMRALMAIADLSTPWRCDGLVADGYVTVLAGKGGEGKSWLTHALAGGTQQGSTVAGIKCKQGRVAIFDAENGPKLIARRFKGIGMPLDALDVYDAAGLALNSAHVVAEIVRALNGVQLAIFDSLRTLAPGVKENDSDEIAPVMNSLREIARKTEAGVLVIHHRGKDSTLAYRGSSAILDQCDVMMVLGRDDKDPERKTRRYLKTEKCRIDEEPDTRWVSLKSVQGEMCLIEAAPYEQTPHATPAQTDLRDPVLDVLKRRAGDPIRAAALAKAVGREKTDKTVRRLLETLRDEQLAREIEGEGWVVNSPSDNLHAQNGATADEQWPF